MKKFIKKGVCVVLSAIMLTSLLTVGTQVGVLRADAASWNGTNYGGGTIAGYRSFLEAFGIHYDVYMKWLDDHDADSANPNYYLGTPYAHYDHRNPRGDCAGAYGAYDTAGVAAMNCTGFVWHVLYKSAVLSGASSAQISQLKVMWEVPYSWANLGVYRIYFDSIEDAYNSGVLEKGDLMWIYGSSDNHNAIYYGDSPEDFIYWDSAGSKNRYAPVHSIGTCRGLWVAKASQPNYIELQADAPSSGSNGSGACFGAKYCVFDSKSKADAVADNPSDMNAWNQRIGTIVLNSSGHGCLRTVAAPTISELWVNGVAQTGLSYFGAAARRVSGKNTYYAVQWSAPPGEEPDTSVRVFRYSGSRTGTGYRIYTMKIPKKVDTPAFSEIKSTADGVKLSWNAVQGADRYRVYYKNRNGGWTRLAETASSSYIDKAVSSGSAYTYTIRCVDTDGDFISDYNTTGWRFTYRRLSTPEITAHESTPDGIRLTWSAVEGAERYRVYFKNSKGGWTRLTETAETEYLDETFNVGSAYTYTVRCVDSAGDFTSNYSTTGWRHTYTGVAVPQMTATQSEAQGIRLTWEPVEGAAKYRLYHKDGAGWTRIAETAETTYFDEDVTAGKSYTYTIRCVNAKGNFISGFDKTGWSCPFEGVTAPQLTGAQNEAQGIRLTWEPVEGAPLYRVYHKNNTGGWTKIAEVAETEYFDDNLTAGESYTYTVRCVNHQGNFISDFDRKGQTAVYNGVATPRITNLESAADGVLIRWDAVEGADLYRVFRKGTSGWQRLGVTLDTSFSDETAESGKTYTYTVRCLGAHDNYISAYDKAGATVTYTPAG